MRRMVVALACVLFVSSVARGEGAQPIRVYTNADLDALPPLPPTGTIHEPRPASEDWKFVMEFIDRERSRLDDERRLRLEQRIADTELDAIRDPRPSYGLAYAPYAFQPGYWGRGGHRAHRFVNDRTVGYRSGLRPKQPGGLIKPLYARPGGTIRPLHARPDRSFRGQGFGGGARPSVRLRPSRGARRR